MQYLIYPPLILNIQLQDLESGNLLLQSAEPIQVNKQKDERNDMKLTK